MSDSEPRRSVVLTIDAEHPDRPGHQAGTCASMLASLRSSSVRAMFFLQGRWVSAHPELAREIVESGHLVGSHSHFHAEMPLLSEQGQMADILAAQQAIESVVGVDPRPWFRSPFGAGLDDPALNALLAQHGYRNIGWDVDGRDWEEGQTAAGVEEEIVSGCLAGATPKVVLLHSWPAVAAEALPGILARLLSAGVDFVTLADLESQFSPPGQLGKESR
ncbi:MAG: polysaccharide deacetylase family protein [Candidatus Dormiibacterota bacterium]